MENNRRDFLKIAGLSALSIGAGSAFNAFAASNQHDATPKPGYLQGEHVLTAKRWGMVIDSRKFESASDLEPIIEACHSIHNVPNHKEKNHEIKWIWEEEFQHGFTDMQHEYVNKRVKHLPFLMLCNHCKNPPCVRACPTKATFQRKDGIVMMDFHRCIGCRFCMAACPYGSRSFNFKDPRPIEHQNPDYPTRMRGVVEKCNFCDERLAIGKMPACVEASNGAIVFGDLDDPGSGVRELLDSNFTIQRKPSLGTGPSVFYIL
jgi:molybdopterin-containing oxidoreductase family iron-sulfur binding subunit